jgi:hypothetical protein
MHRSRMWLPFLLHGAAIEDPAMAYTLQNHPITLGVMSFLSLAPQRMLELLRHSGECLQGFEPRGSDLPSSGNGVHTLPYRDEGPRHIEHHVDRPAADTDAA